MSMIISSLLIEDDIVSWIYPEIDDTIRDLVLNLVRATTTTTTTTTFAFSKFGETWLYWRRESSFSLVLTCLEFHPEKYSALLALQAARYAANRGSVVDSVLRPFLAVFLSGAVDDTAWRDADYDFREAFLAGSLRQLLLRFGADDTIRLWAAMMAKRRILVTAAASVDELLAIVRSLPLLSFHRQNFNLLRPLVLADNAAQLGELKELGAAYVAGILGTAAAAPTSLADVIVDVGARRVRVLDERAADLSQFEQSLATMLGELASDTAQDDAAIVKALLLKSKALVSRLAALGGGAPLTRDIIRNSDALPDDLKTLCVAIANAEGLLGGGTQ
jgi:hypothetical protein